jgi:hypothetical protein
MLHYQFSVTFDVYGHGYHKTLNVHTCMHTTVTLLLIHSNNHKRSTLKPFSKVDTFSIAGCGKASGNECLITGWLAEGEKNRTKDCGCGLFGSWTNFAATRREKKAITRPPEVSHAIEDIQ